MEFYFIFLLLVWLPCAFYSGATAKSKGHGGMEWGIGGLLFGPIALVAAAGLSDHKIQRYQRFLAEAAGYQNSSTPSDWKKQGDANTW